MTYLTMTEQEWCPGSGWTVSAIRVHVTCPSCGGEFRQKAEYAAGMNLWRLPDHVPSLGAP